MDLIKKPDAADLQEKMPWERTEEPISEARWRKHRATMLAECGPGRRPVEWWAYESPRKPPRKSSRKVNMLFEIGELSEAELAELMPEWREQFGKAQAPDFAWCIGCWPGINDAHWLTGNEAREAYLEWTGMPDKIISRFTKQRHRERRAVEALGELSKKSRWQN